MIERKRAALAALALLAVVIFHIAVAWQDFATLARDGFLYDDSFYAFKIARNMASGNGMTFDGVNSTTGFQPLYVFMLVPLYKMFPADPVMPIYAALSVLAVCATVATWLLFRIARRYVGTAAAACAAALWTFSPVVARQSANGLETAVAAMLIALAAWYYLTRVRPDPAPSFGRLFILGLILGLAVLSRIDSIFLGLVIILDKLFILRRSRAAFSKAAPLLLVPLGAMVFYGPWLILNMAQCGTPLQDSGTATRFLSLAYASYFGYSPASLAEAGPDLSFILGHISHSLATMKVIPPVHVIFRAMEKAGHAASAPGLFRGAGDVAGILALAAAAVLALRWRRNPARSRRLETGFLLMFSLLLLASYSLYIFGAFFYLRYYFPVFLTASLYFAFILQDIFDMAARRKASTRRLMAAAAGIYLCAFGYFSWSQSFDSHPVYPYYDIARWVDENIGDQETVGVFQCGTIGYLSDRRIINLDGKVNRDALTALKKGRIEGYIEKEGIDVVMDHSKILSLFLDIPADQIRSCSIPVDCGPAGPLSGWVAIPSSAIARSGGGGGSAIHPGSSGSSYPPGI